MSDKLQFVVRYLGSQNRCGSTGLFTNVKCALKGLSGPGPRWRLSDLADIARFEYACVPRLVTLRESWRTSLGTVLLIVASPVLSISLLLGLFSGEQDRPAQTDSRAVIDPEEYAVYSAFIDQKYIHPSTRGGFSLTGTVIDSFGPAKIEQVVILPQTLFTLEQFISGKNLRDRLPVEAQAAFNDCLRLNGKSYPLAGNFSLKVNYTLLSKQDEAEFASNDSDQRMDRFAALHPHALGYLALSRVGFTPAHNIAVVSFAQTDFDVRTHGTRGKGGLVLLSKESGSWLVREVFTDTTETKPLTIEPSRCNPLNQSLAWGLGSANISVKGQRGLDCIIEHVSEVEGGYTQSECAIPSSLGTLTIYQGGIDFYYSLDVSKFCKVTKSRNSLMESLKPQ
jgi:hypothetical protein